MGKSNRQRRAAKKRKPPGGRGAPPGRSAGSTSSWPPPDSDFGADDRDPRAARADEQRELERLEALVVDAAVRGDRDAAVDLALDRFERSALRFGSDVVPSMVARHLREALHAAWHRGWLPADLRCLLRKEDAQLDLLALGARHELHGWPAGFAPDAWQRQLADLEDGPVRALGARGIDDAEAWLAGHPNRDAPARRAALRTGAFLLAVLVTLPSIPVLETVPCEWSEHSRPGRRTVAGAIDPAMLAKIRALLAKAESTTFEAEAMALTAKAQALIAKHSIDAALLAGSTAADDERPRGRRLPVDDPYAQEKALLLSAITGANRCRAVWLKEAGFSTVFGFGSDLDAVELLYTSLLVQASIAMQAAGSQRDASGRSTTRSFRRSFLVGYANRIAQRLDEATSGSVANAEAEAGRSLVPVLVARDEQVEDVAREAFPRATHKTSYVSNASGYVAGQRAADRATLGPDVAVTR